MTNANRLLIIEDDADFRALVALAAREIGFEVADVAPPERFLEIIAAFQPSLILLDLMMPAVDGIQVLRTLADQGCEVDIILISGADARVLHSTARVAADRGLRIAAVLRKPIELHRLATLMGRHLRVAPVSADDLRGAISERQITVNYQPKVSLAPPGEWVVEGVEALARWDHPRHGAILPSDFFSVAQQSGLIGKLTTTVFRHAIGQARELRDKGYRVDVSVNVPANLLESKEFPDRVHRELSEQRLEGTTLIIEVTESAPISCSVSLMENLSRMRLRGVRLSMDDFGIGYSSLAQLSRVPFSELKIDRSFICEIETTDESRIIVASIIDLAHRLGLTVCAEGVETRETLEFLRSAGCDQAQGFLISQPLSGGDLSHFLADNLYRQTSRVASARTCA